MAKKSVEKVGRSYRSWMILGAAAAGVAAIGWTQYDQVVEVKDRLVHYVDNAEIATLEARFTPEQIMLAHRQELLGTGKRSFLDSTTTYYPYLLMDVKYTEDQKPREGTVLWGYHNGEIVLQTETWDTTHGFKDCLECRANRNDFKIIQALARRGGAITVEELQKELKAEPDQLAAWIKEAKDKHLIVQRGQAIQLHFENPRFLVIPQTRVRQQIVTKPITGDQRAAKVYSRSQILTLAQAAFGSDFKIRHEQDIFLPVVKLQVANPDGSILTSEWNALTGMPFKSN